GAVERRLERHQGIEVLRHLPQQEVAVSPYADQPVRPQQQMPVEALDRLAELDLRARLALGGEPAPRGVELVEGEADDLAALGGLGRHGAESKLRFPPRAPPLRAAPSKSSSAPAPRSPRRSAPEGGRAAPQPRSRAAP